uniref:HTH psq-type domain-containing protein n=1 Tax=Romanomermis culicivorax TaxID=13658 RepID=A0A915JUF0_ROMCU
MAKRPRSIFDICERMTVGNHKFLGIIQVYANQNRGTSHWLMFSLAAQAGASLSFESLLMSTEESPTKRKYLEYSQESLAAAVQAVNNNLLTPREAAAQFGIPRSTVWSRTRGLGRSHTKKMPEDFTDGSYLDNNEKPGTSFDDTSLESAQLENGKAVDLFYPGLK